MSKIQDNIRANPMTWKDWLATITLAVTVGTVMLQGGRILERQDQMNSNLDGLRAQLGGVQVELQRINAELLVLRGSDRLHDEQISNLRRELDDAKNKARR